MDKKLLEKNENPAEHASLDECKYLLSRFHVNTLKPKKAPEENKAREEAEWQVKNERDLGSHLHGSHLRTERQH